MVEDVCKDFKNEAKTKYEEDQESLKDRCWYPKIETDSRPYLIRDASYRTRLSPEPKCSIMRSSYMPPVFDDRPTLGIRKSQLLQKFQKEAEDEVAEERYPKPPETYSPVTTNDCDYRVEGFEVDDKFFMKDNELYGKYPLYSASAPPTTYTTFKLRRNASDLTPGITAVTNKTQPFRKCCGFSKPVHEKLNSRW